MSELTMRVDNAAIIKATEYMADTAPGMFRGKSLAEVISAVRAWAKMNTGTIGGAYIREDLYPIVANRLMLRIKVQDGIIGFFEYANEIDDRTDEEREWDSDQAYYAKIASA